MRTTIFIAPHLDDAVFSCAGMIQRAVASGEKVIVATVFTEGSNGYAERRAEDEAAVRWLGAERVHLGQTDAPDRHAAYRNFREIIFGWQPEDHQTIRSVVGLLQGLAAHEAGSRMVVPLGVGTHVDHRIVHEAAKQLTWPGDVWFYEDRPYAWAHGAVELRLHELGNASGTVDVPSLWRTFRQLPQVRRYLPPGAERRHCESLLIAPLEAGLKSGMEAMASWLECSGVETSGAHRAAGLYGSQFPHFCGSRRSLKRMDRAHSLRLGSSADRTERYWRLSGSQTQSQPNPSSNENPAPD